MKKVDFLIIGQGLAGTVLAYQLVKCGKKVLIIDRYDESSSSRVAAGLFNPITGKKYVKTWRADDLFEYLYNFYPQIEKYLQSKFFYPTEIFRPFSSIQDQNDWHGKSADQEYNKYVKRVIDSSFAEYVNSPHGGLLLDRGGYVDLPAMLKSAREKFFEENCLIDGQFIPHDLNCFDNYVVYQDIHAEKIIFCNGHLASQSKFFHWLPFRPVKGEVLFLESKMDMDRIYNKGCFITPKINGLHKCGSTYDWRDNTTKPTMKARDTIMEKLNALIKEDVEVVYQKAGIRPATADRRPLLGIHPEIKTIGIFNGLGTKGVSLAPYFSEQFVRHLLDGTNIDTEVDIKRYYSLYYKLESID